jgi:hypothetical protein
MKPMGQGTFKRLQKIADELVLIATAEGLQYIDISYCPNVLSAFLTCRTVAGVSSYKYLILAGEKKTFEEFNDRDLLKGT